MVQMLLNKSVEVNTQDGWYDNVLQAALHEDHQTMVQMLLNKSAEVNAQDGYYGNTLQTAS